MALTGRLHPLLLHFPIALILVAAAAELVAIVARRGPWHVVALANVRAGALFTVAAAITGWLLASASVVDDVRTLEWHRWIGTAAVVATIGAALASTGIDGQSPKLRSLYLIALFWAAALVAITGHLGARLVWGADFLRP